MRLALHDDVLRCRLSRMQKVGLDILAAERKVSVSDLVRQAIERLFVAEAEAEERRQQKAKLLPLVLGEEARRAAERNASDRSDPV